MALTNNLQVVSNNPEPVDTEPPIALIGGSLSFAEWTRTTDLRVTSRNSITHVSDPSKQTSNVLIPPATYTAHFHLFFYLYQVRSKIFPLKQENPM